MKSFTVLLVDLWHNPFMFHIESSDHNDINDAVNTTLTRIGYDPRKFRMILCFDGHVNPLPMKSAVCTRVHPLMRVSKKAKFQKCSRTE